MMQTGLYFVGEAIADQRPDPSDARRMIVSLGGSMYFGSMGAANAIKRHAIADIRSFYVGTVSRDHFGQIITNDFKTAGVGMEYVRHSDFISMIAVISEDGKGGNKYSFYGRNQPNTTEHLQLADLPADFAEDQRYFCFGSVATTLSPSGQTLKEFAAIQRKADAVVLYDPNTRPSVITDVDAYRAALESWVSTASLTKASEEDVAFTYPGRSEADVAAHWLSLGAQAVFITHGIRGCSVYSRDGHAFIASQNNPGIVRTVGAGDNFNAGIVIGLSQAGIRTHSDLARMSQAEWQSIASGANDTSFAHLLGINNL